MASVLVTRVAANDDGHGNGQVEGGPLLANPGRSQIDGDLPGRRAAAAVAQGGQNPVPAFPDLGIGQPHQLHTGQSTADIHLDS